ncbi:MAG: ribosomal protein S18-alanine N-acetyltransferase [Nocardioides sp.]
MRTAVATDLDRLVELEDLCEGSAAWSVGLIAAGVAGTIETTTWLLDDQGYAVVSLVDEVAELQRIGVHPDHRRQGLGRRLLHAVIDLARQRGADRMLLEVRESNPAAFSLYLDTGFVEIARRARYYSDGETAIVMELELAPPGS